MNIIQKTHNMTFENDADHDQRKQLFKETNDLIEEHENSDHSKHYNLTHNKFSTMVFLK